MKWYQSKYFLAFAVGLILGIFGAAQQAVQILSRHNPDYGTVAGALLIGLALFVDVLPRPNQIVAPQVRAENVEQMTVNPPATGSSAVNLSAAMRKVVTPPPRAKSGRFERTTVAKVPPVDVVSDH